MNIPPPYIYSVLQKATTDVVTVSLHPKSQSTKNNSANLQGKYEEIDDVNINDDEIYDEIAVKTFKMFSSHERLLGLRIRN